MNGNSTTIRRILVALDASPSSLAALEAAADLARQMGANLLGLYIEDVNLLKLARYPFVNEIQYPRATVKKFDTADLENQLRKVAERARAVLRESAEKRNVDWNFRVTRGVVATEIQTAADEADLLVLGRISRRLVRSARVGSTALSAVTETRQSVLLLHSELDLQRSVLLFYDGSPEAQKALAIAASLARVSGALHIMLWAAGEQEEQKFRREIVDQLKDFEISLKFRRLSARRPTAYLMALADFGLFVIGDTHEEPSQSIVQTLLQDLEHPFLLVR